jgi:hypothetical protein
MLDYPVGILLIAAPWIFGFTDVNDAQTVAIVVGAVILLQSLITDYELSLANVLPLPAHLGLDVIAGLFLAVSPWLFGFNDAGANAWVPHLVAGIGVVLSGLLTQHHRRTRRDGELTADTAADRRGRTGERLRPSGERTRVR